MKIGALVFSNKGQIKVGRDGRKNYSFDGVRGAGFNKILTELKYPYSFCSTATINEFDHVLCSLTSYHDILNLVNNIPIRKKAKVHIGGPACNNINPIIDYIDTANFGRCDNGKINKIINGEKLDSVWRKKDDPYFEGEYCVDSSDISGLGIDEDSFGCQQKCAFCFYSHWNGFVAKKSTLKYSSGFSNYEDFFQSLDWAKCIRGGVTALDGCTEKTRLLVRKPIKEKDVINTLLKSNSIETKTLLRAKIYCIVGYPWEKHNCIDDFDLVKIIRNLHKELKNKITLRMHFSHFIPFQKTPLWDAPFNFNNYRDWCLNNKLLFESEKIKVFSGGTFTGSPSQAAISTILQRAKIGDSAIIKKIADKSFLNKKSNLQVHILKTELPQFFNRQETEAIPNIKTLNKIVPVRY